MLAKAHKLAWNGLDVRTDLSVAELTELALSAAQESTGDLVHGMQRISPVRSSDRHMEFRINDFMLAYKKLLVFSLDFSRRSGRTELSTKIDWYLTERQNVAGFLPVGAKQMVGHSTYMQFLHGLSRLIRTADADADISIREGGEGAAPAVPQLVPQAAAPAPTREAVKPAPSFAPVAPYLREDAPSYSPATPAEAPTDDDRSTDLSGLPEQWPDPVELSSGRLYFGDLRERSSVAVPVAIKAERLAEHEHEVAAPDSSLTVVLKTEMVEDAPAEVADLDPSAERAWVLTMANGKVIPVECSLVLGRNPELPPGMPGAEAVVVADPDRSVSKTHAIIEARDGDLWVTDLASTNGSRFTNASGGLSRCEPGVATKVESKCQLRLGKYRIVVGTR